MSMKTQLRSLLAGLRDKSYRALFVETEIETLIPFQIRAMRKKQGWNQKELARHAGMTQARISVLENPSYEGAVNVKTLVKLASAFDVALVVRFVPFSELAEWTSRLSYANHEVANFEVEWQLATEHEQVYRETSVATATAPVTSRVVVGPWKENDPVAA